MKKKQKASNQLMQNKMEEYKDIIMFANYIYEQIKLQQNARDKWMGNYQVIVGIVISFSTFILAFFKDTIKTEELEFILGLIFAVTGFLGIIFYLLFLCQRINYKLHYKVLGDIQKIIIAKYLNKPYESYYPNNRSPFKKLKKGADFYASAIHNTIITICFVLSSLFVLLSFGINIKQTIIICILVVILLIIILKNIYNIFEEVI